MTAFAASIASAYAFHVPGVYSFSSLSAATQSSYNFLRLSLFTPSGSTGVSDSSNLATNVRLSSGVTL